jgi:hypothetical protein
MAGFRIFSIASYPCSAAITGYKYIYASSGEWDLFSSCNYHHILLETDPTPGDFRIPEYAPRHSECEYLLSMVPINHGLFIKSN